MRGHERDHGSLKINVNNIGVKMSHMDDEDSLTADDLILTVGAAAKAARSSGNQTLIKISIFAEDITNKALREPSEEAHLRAIFIHNKAWKMYRKVALETLANDAMIKAINEHEKAIFIHQVLVKRFMRMMFEEPDPKLS